MSLKMLSINIIIIIIIIGNSHASVKGFFWSCSSTTKHCWIKKSFCSTKSLCYPDLAGSSLIL